MGKFDGKVALVTGAGRMRGIGRYAALAFAKEGASVAVTGTGRDRLESGSLSEPQCLTNTLSGPPALVYAARLISLGFRV